MLRIVKNIFLISLPTILVMILLLELFFWLIIPASRLPQAIFSNDDLLYMYKPNQEGIYSIGKFAQIRSKYRINNAGWNSAVDYQKEKTRKRIAIIGDSYVEALQVDYNQSVASSISEKLNEEYDVYSFGISGAPLSQYLHMNKYVNKYYNPDIIIINLVHNDFDESISTISSEKHLLRLEINDHSIDEIPPEQDLSFSEHNWWKKLLKKSSTIRYLFFNLKIKELLNSLNNDTKKYEANIDVQSIMNQKRKIVKATDYLIKELKKENLNRNMILIMDAPRASIYTGDVDDNNAFYLNLMVKELSIKNNVFFMDLTQDMITDYNINNKKFNSDHDSHWNEYGHQFVAMKVIRFLNEKNLF